ncbi:MAG: rubredoxin [Spirochaetales bacterium]|nr:rubredoxin [Spirochaetales bacterium]
MTTYRCSICDYVYYPKNGGKDNAAEIFENLPTNWRCPGCGSRKICFVKVEKYNSMSKVE